jgi:hypothetical protein
MIVSKSRTGNWGKSTSGTPAEKNPKPEQWLCQSTLKPPAALVCLSILNRGSRRTNQGFSFNTAFYFIQGNDSLAGDQV